MSKKTKGKAKKSSAVKASAEKVPMTSEESFETPIEEEVKESEANDSVEFVADDLQKEPEDSGESDVVIQQREKRVKKDYRRKL